MLASWSISGSAYADDVTCDAALNTYRQCISEKSGSCAPGVLRSYTGNLFKEMNDTLRGVSHATACVPLVAVLRQELLRHPLVSGVSVYRGTVMTENLQNLKVGSCLSDQAFLSTSLSREIAESFNKGALFIIKSVSGRNVEKVSAVPDEREVLFAPSVVFRLDRITRKNDDDGKVVSVKYSLTEVQRSSCVGTVSFQSTAPVVLSSATATYGGNLDSKVVGNATKDVTDYCVKDGASQCRYLVSSQYVGNPFPEKEKSFRLIWACSRALSEIAKYSLRIPAPAEGAEFDFGCNSNGAPLFKMTSIPAALVKVVIDRVGTAAADYTKTVKSYYEEPAGIVSLAVSPRELGIGDEVEKPGSVPVSYRCVSKAASVYRSGKFVWDSESGTMKAELSCAKLFSVQPL